MEKTVSIGMRLGRPSSLVCESAREQLSAGLDEGLDELQDARLNAHLAVCRACSAFRDDLEGVAGLLRAAPLEQPDFPVVLPRRRLVSARGFQAGAAAAAVALVA